MLVSVKSHARPWQLQVNDAMGASLGSVAVTLALAEPVSPSSSVTVSVTV